MIRNNRGILVDPAEGVVTLEMIRRWVSHPREAHKAKECIDALAGGQELVEEAMAIYCASYHFGKDRYRFNISPVGVPEYDAFPYSLSDVEAGDSFFVRSSAGWGNPTMSSFMVEESSVEGREPQRLRFEEGCLLRVLFPPTSNLHYNPEPGHFQQALEMTECLLHSQYRSRKMLEQMFPALYPEPHYSYAALGWGDPPPPGSYRSVLSFEEYQRQLFDHFPHLEAILCDSSNNA